MAVAAGAGVWFLARSERIGALRALGLTLTVLVILGPVIQPWYLSWGLVLLAPVATGKVRSLIVSLSVATAFLGLPGGRQLVNDLLHSNPLAVAAALLVLLAILTVPLTSERHRKVGSGAPRPGSGPDALPEEAGTGRGDPSLDLAEA